MNLEALKRMIVSLRKEIKSAESFLRAEENARAIAYSRPLSSGNYSFHIPSVYAKLKNVVANALKLLPDNKEYISTSWDQWEGMPYETNRDTLYLDHATGAVAILDYILELMEAEKKSQKQIRQRKFFANAGEKLKEAGSTFDKGDYPSTMNNLNTALELALREIADIPSTVTKINTANLIERWISNKMPNSNYLSEARKCVLDIVNKIKHAPAYQPTQPDCIKGMAGIENLFRKLKGVKLTDDMKMKLYEGVR